ncbi:FliM/FliN family flagellar motor switch protein [Novosphingobium sp. AAP1]|uniref:FliM/FliN family flagellar motor switch protein n=1 Tax=Novosphingobium sp. AAP1 TaxID=1523413 RepID=UPI0018D02E06|nr:FliM/FliN family flagellar motor switch protein [Novosphingobium sp. AAP1]
MRQIMEQVLPRWLPHGHALDIAPGRLAGRGILFAGSFGSLQIAENELPALGQAACNGEGDTGNPADRRILDHLGRQVVQGIADLLDEQLGFQPTNSDTNEPYAQSASLLYHRLRRQGEEWTLSLAMRPDAVVRLRRQVAGTARVLSAPVPLLEALGEVPVDLGCHLGCAGLVAGDIATLSPGDLIVLDGIVAQPAALTVNGALAQAGQARVARKGDTLTIAVTQSVRIERKHNRFHV